MALDQLRTLFNEAGLEDEFQIFTIKSGVKSVLVFAWVAATEEELLNRVVKPWLTSLEEGKRYFTFAPSAWRAFPLISRALAIDDLAWM